MLEEETAERRRQRIHYPSGSWFPLQIEVLDSVFSKLREHRSRQLYLAMYEYVQRPQSKGLRANLTDLSKLIHCDARTARSCIVELVGEGFVKMGDEGGKLRSRIEKTIFAVPLAEEKLDTGYWFPVPRFLVTDYLPTYPGSIVLIALLYFQHLKWKPYCYPSVKTLVRVLGIDRRSVYHYLNTMGHEARWKRLGTNLPRPLEISYSPDRRKRRFSVRAAQFYALPGRKKPLVKLHEEFAIHFGGRRKAAANTAEHVHSGW